MVLEDAWIFTGTIADNIGYGKPNATREETESAQGLPWQITLYPYITQWIAITILNRGGDDSPKVNANQLPSLGPS